MRTVRPRISSSAPNAAAVRPLPSDDTTPPVTKMYFTGGEVEAARSKRARKSSDQHAEMHPEFSALALDPEETADERYQMTIFKPVVRNTRFQRGEASDQGRPDPRNDTFIPGFIVSCPIMFRWAGMQVPRRCRGGGATRLRPCQSPLNSPGETPSTTRPRPARQKKAARAPISTTSS